MARDRGAGRLQPRLDLTQHGQDLGRVWFLHQNHLALLHCQRVGAGVEIRLRQFARSFQRILVSPDLVVGFLQYLQRLVIIGLCLSNGLKHLDGLENLTMLFV